MSDEAISSVVDCISKVTGWIEANGVYDVWWYRGQPNTNALPTPQIYRSDFISSAKNRKDVGVDPIVHFERTLFQEFKRPAAPFFAPLTSDVEKYFYAQHHGLPTRLVDWTSNLLTALWFACAPSSDVSDQRDGYLFALKPELLMKNLPDKVGAFTTPDDPLVKMALAGALWKEESAESERLSKSIIPVVPDDSVARFAKQHSCFTLHMPDARCLPKFNETGIWRIKDSVKAAMLTTLRNCGVTEFSIYYTPDHLAREIKKRFAL